MLLFSSHWWGEQFPDMLVPSREVCSIVETDPPDILPYTHIMHISESHGHYHKRSRHHKQSIHACVAERNHSYNMQRVLGIAGMGEGGKDQQGNGHQAWTSQRFWPLPCYCCRMKGGARAILDARYLALCCSSPLPVGPAEVAWALGYPGSCKVFGPDSSGTSDSGFGGFGHDRLSHSATCS